jgi:hypothetical protein
MDGTLETEDGGWCVDDGASELLARRCSFFLRHSSHSPDGPGVPPQAHLRCNGPPRTGVKDEGSAGFGLACNLVSIFLTLHEISAQIASA